MKERGIIFNSEMVRAILDGPKTQTRGVINSEISGNCFMAKKNHPETEKLRMNQG